MICKEWFTSNKTTAFCRRWKKLIYSIKFDTIWFMLSQYHYEVRMWHLLLSFRFKVVVVDLHIAKFVRSDHRFEKSQWHRWPIWMFFSMGSFAVGAQTAQTHETTVAKIVRDLCEISKKFCCVLTLFDMLGISVCVENSRGHLARSFQRRRSRKSTRWPLRLRSLSFRPRNWQTEYRLLIYQTYLYFHNCPTGSQP